MSSLKEQIMSKQPDISIIIPSYNSEKTISACLKSVLNQKTNLVYEVILVDSSVDKTPNIVKSDFSQIKFIHFKKKTPAGKARNIGIKAAKSGIVVCLDSDCFAASDNWLNQIYKAHEKHDIVGARVGNGNPRNLFGWGIFLMEFCEWITKKDKNMKMLLSYNISYKRKIFQKYGYFPESSFLNEELLFNSKVKEPLFFSSRIEVKHINRTNFYTIVRHCFKLGFGGGMARKQMSTLPGSFLVRYPVLIILLPFARLFLSGLRSLQANYLLIFLLVSPLILINSISYSIGFLISSIKKEENQ